MTLIRVVCFAIWLSTSSTCWPQDARARRDALAEAIVDNQSARLELDAIEEEMLDAQARTIVLHLGRSGGLGPDHPAWPVLLQDVKPGLKALLKEVLPMTRMFLRQALVDQLSEAQLTEIESTLRALANAEFRLVLAQLGLSPAMTMRTFSMVTTPSIYSKAELSELRKGLETIKVREREIVEKLPEMKAALSALQAPALRAYRELAVRSLGEASRLLEGMSAIRAHRQRLFNFWREQVERELATPR